MPSNFQTISVNSPYVLENPQTFWVGESKIFNANWAGTGTLSSPVNTLLRGKEDVSATYLSGSTTVSGRVQTSKLATFSVAGEYELYFQVTDGSMIRIKALRILIRKLGVY